MASKSPDATDMPTLPEPMRPPRGQLHMLHKTTTIGDFTLHALEGGRLRLDGGAMFGVVPKPLWEKRIRADERNRIPLALRCLLVETPDALVLIDNGVGNKEDAKFLDIYGIENEATDGSPTRLEQAIRELGFDPGDVDWVFDTHLHFDHAGGNTYLDEEGQLRLSFPRARYVVQKGELAWAHRANERTRASYFDRNYDPVLGAGRLGPVPGARSVDLRRLSARRHRRPHGARAGAHHGAHAQADRDRREQDGSRRPDRHRGAEELPRRRFLDPDHAGVDARHLSAHLQEARARYIGAPARARRSAPEPPPAPPPRPP